MPETNSTPETDATRDAARRRAYVNGLRQLASFLEEYPELPVPFAGVNALSLVEDKAAMSRVARTPGVRWAKLGTDAYLRLSASFEGDHTYGVCIARTEVCRKKILGTHLEPAQPAREVEDYVWECTDALLAAGGEA